MSVVPDVPELTLPDFVELINADRTCMLLHDAVTKRILWANPAACEVLERSVAELRPLTAADMSSSAQQYDRVLGRAWLHDAVEQGTNRIEWHYRSRSGRVIPTDAVAVRVELSQGPAVLVQFRNIERELQIERELRLTTSYVETLSRHTAAGSLVLSPDGVVQHATDRALEQLGVMREELAGHRLESVCTIHTDRRHDPRARGWTAAVEIASPIGSIRLNLRGTSDGPAWLGGTIERMTQPGVEEFVMTLHDISARVRDEEHRERELDRENYLARYNAMGDMAMAIAHELGQPMAAAGNFLAGVRTRIDGLDASPELVARINYGLDSATRQISRASAIVSVLRSFVGHLEHIEQDVDLNDIVAECLYFVRLRADAVGVTVEAVLNPEPVLVRCERVLTGQVVMNLCFNAIEELTGAEGDRTVVLTTRPDGDAGFLAVDDSGSGFATDPFAESFTSKEHGSGIGLALSHRIITRQHGTIWAEHRAGRGSRFAFRLPVAGPHLT
jgi:C4-dicarboxylate-specific signal transduction histidine kinase